jgi:cobalt/nickel transport system permease protein
MGDIAARYRKMLTMDELSDRNTAVNRVNPIIKLVVTLVYLLLVVSYDKYDISGLMPLFLYPVIIITAGDIPIKPILSGLIAASPLVIGAGIFNPLLDREIAVTISGLNISAGMLSFISLLIKCALTVSAAMLLLASTGINRLAAAMHRLHIPQIFIIQLLLTYRYISVLTEEASRMSTAYRLRAPGQKGININVWGSLLGSLLLAILWDEAQGL